jgi:hypothetical protein
MLTTTAMSDDIAPMYPSIGALVETNRRNWDERVSVHLADRDHALSDILCGLIDHGLRIDFLHEHETVPWRMFPMMMEVGDGMYGLPDGYPRIPLSFSLKASKRTG